MAAAQAGDKAAYRRLLQEIVPFLRTVIAKRHRQADRIDDVVQDTLLTLHRVRHTYDPRRPFVNWIAAIAERRSLDALRREFRRAAGEHHDPAAYETFADPRANSEITAGLEAAPLHEAIAELPSGQRRAVELLKLKELTLIEASKESGLSVSALKVSLHRALQTLRKRLPG